MERLEEKLIAAWERIKRSVDEALTGTTEDEREWDAFLDRMVAVRTGKAPALEARDEWILCAVHQPPQPGTYLTTTDRGKVRTDHWYDEPHEHWGHKGRTIAWRPLPEAYKGAVEY